MFDKPVEIAMTLNLLKPEKELQTGTSFNKKYLAIKGNKEGVKGNLKISRFQE